MAQPQTNHEPFEITVEKLVYGGEGLGRRNGQVVLAPFVLPGERVTVETVEQKSGLLRTRLVAVREPAPGRISPCCPYFGRCGGCHYQHGGYDLQLALKRSILAETLLRVGKFQPPDDIRVVAAEPWGYRNRSQFHIRGTQMGYWEAHSHQLCAIDHCPISSPRINGVIATLQEMLRDPRWPRFLRSIELFTNEAEVQLNVRETERPVARRFFDWCAERISGLVSGVLDYPAAGALYRVSRSSFFQGNRFLAEQLVDTALELAEGASALDLYAGVGLFSLPLARRFDTLTAVESSAAAVRDLEFNAGRAALAVNVAHHSVAPFLQDLANPPDFVLADPPRAGLGNDVVRHLARLQPSRITIVACDPATLARDLAGLLAAGYRLDRIALVDLFPQTFHLESVVHLSRNARSC